MEKIVGLVVDGEEWFNVASAADLAGVSVEAIYKSIERGRLESRTMLGVVAIAKSDIVRLWPAKLEPEVVG